MQGEGQLTGLVIGITGDGPLPANRMVEIAEKEGAYIGTADIWQLGQILVLGQSAFDETYLKRSIEIAKFASQRETGDPLKVPCRYMSQEAFVHYLRDGTEPHYYHSDPRVVQHPGLWFLSALGFRWPSTYAPPGLGHGASDKDYGDKSELVARFRYSVARDVSRAERRSALRLAVQPPPQGMGLQAVAQWIAVTVQWRKSQLSDRMRGAIERWEEDLQWLYDEYYLKSTDSFVWPSTAL